MERDRHSALVWGLIGERVALFMRLALGLCFVVPGALPGFALLIGLPDVGLDARAALLLGVAPLFVLGCCGALRWVVARQWRRGVLIGGTALGGVVGLSAIFPLSLTLYLPLFALITGGPALLILAVLAALAGGLALALATQLLRAVVLLDELSVESVRLLARLRER